MMMMYQKVAFILVAVLICWLADGLPVVRVDNSENKDGIKTIPAGKSSKPDASFEKSIERGKNGGDDTPGVVLVAKVDQKEASQETLVHSLSEDASTITFNSGILRQQSNDLIKGSEVKDVNLSVLTDLSLG